MVLSSVLSGENIYGSLLATYQSLRSHPPIWPHVWGVVVSGLTHCEQFWAGQSRPRCEKWRWHWCLVNVCGMWLAYTWNVTEQNIYYIMKRVSPMTTSQLLWWLTITHSSSLTSGSERCTDIISLAYWLKALFFQPKSYFFLSSGDSLSLFMVTALPCSPGDKNTWNVVSKSARNNGFLLVAPGQTAACLLTQSRTANPPGALGSRVEGLFRTSGSITWSLSPSGSLTIMRGWLWLSSSFLRNRSGISCRIACWNLCLSPWCSPSSLGKCSTGFPITGCSCSKFRPSSLSLSKRSTPLSWCIFRRMTPAKPCALLLGSGPPMPPPVITTTNPMKLNHSTGMAMITLKMKTRLRLQLPNMMLLLLLYQSLGLADQQVCCWGVKDWHQCAW